MGFAVLEVNLHGTNIHLNRQTQKDQTVAIQLDGHRGSELPELSGADCIALYFGNAGSNCEAFTQKLKPIYENMKEQMNEVSEVKFEVVYVHHERSLAEVTFRKAYSPEKMPWLVAAPGILHSQLYQIFSPGDGQLIVPTVILLTKNTDTGEWEELTRRGTSILLNPDLRKGFTDQFRPGSVAELGSLWQFGKADIQNINSSLKDFFEDEDNQKRWGIPGISWAVYNNEYIECGVTGYARIEGDNWEHMTIEHMFNTASTGKAMTCFAVTLFEEYLGEIWEMTVPEAWPYNQPYIHKGWQQVKMKDFAAMIGGIDDFSVMRATESYRSNDSFGEFIADTENKGRSGTFENDVELRETFINFLLAMPPSLDPRSRFSYSNYGYGLIGAVLEKEYAKKHPVPAGEPPKGINDIVSETLKSLGMTNNYLTTRNCPDELEHIRVRGHSGSNGSMEFNGHSIRPMEELGEAKAAVEDPAGVTYTSPGEAAQYCQHVLKKLMKSRPVFRNPAIVFDGDEDEDGAKSGVHSRTSEESHQAAQRVQRVSTNATAAKLISSTLEVPHTAAIEAEVVKEFGFSSPTRFLHSDRWCTNDPPLHESKTEHLNGNAVQNNPDETGSQYSCPGCHSDKMHAYGIEATKRGYGLGWFVEDLLITPSQELENSTPYQCLCVSHPGSFDGMFNSFVIFPDFNIGFCAHNNKLGGSYCSEFPGSKFEMVYKFGQLVVDYHVKMQTATKKNNNPKDFGM